MVKVAVAGGSGNVATEVLREPIAAGHEVTILTRQDCPKSKEGNVSYQKVDYTNVPSLTSALRGHDACLSFLLAHLDRDNVIQKNLIQACMEAGVRRFAPSEWGIKNQSGVPEYENKDTIAVYLAELNAKDKKLEYCLFQPSIFMDYFGHPFPLSPGLITWPFFIDPENRRALILEDGASDIPICLTAVKDISKVVELALRDEREWPAKGQFRGARTTINELLATCKRVRPGSWTVESVKPADVFKRELKTSWVPRFNHPAVPEKERQAYSTEFLLNFFRGVLNGSWETAAVWNERVEDELDFMGLERYLTDVWHGKE